MNWTHFLLWVAGLYGCYYLAIILIDTMRAKQQPDALSDTHQLTFSETVTPEKLSAPAAEPVKKTHQAAMPKPQKTEVVASGGVPLTDLFRLAKQEAIIYTRSVSF